MISIFDIGDALPRCEFLNPATVESELNAILKKYFEALEEGAKHEKESPPYNSSLKEATQSLKNAIDLIRSAYVIGSTQGTDDVSNYASLFEKLIDGDTVDPSQSQQFKDLRRQTAHQAGNSRGHTFVNAPPESEGVLNNAFNQFVGQDAFFTRRPVHRTYLFDSVLNNLLEARRFHGI